ncbi:9742_t:CDS:1, partial [Racocetra fulgida]
YMEGFLAPFNSAVINAAQLKELIESMTKFFEDVARDIIRGNG